MSVWKFLSQILLIAVCVLLAYVVCSHVKYSNVTDIISVLQNISAIVFAISGVWIGYLYPNAIAGLMKNEKIDFFASKNEAKKVEGMILIIIISAFVLVGIALFYLMVILLKGSEFYRENYFIIKLSGLSFILYMIFMQIRCVFLMIRKNISFINKLHRFLNEKELNSKL
ncbi:MULTISPECIES: hypothetical protein [unclassified Photorhabdus]|uniref:hypothetical protein n=1 Tax=unclassified Photorhabdus TaxID=2620880 RepID=UPI000DCD5F9E|nr:MULTISPECIES: hypothetical protein [unclassified Photorhabdus]RAW92164.1 hypothetical protein CKY05_23440 [Photorhabdus sp. S10-54]RAW92203.1 hypothetical protein CKY03_23335 [Photorhabdus sp. S9-53]RAW95849.1 hypothetical protein CKY04_23350 [Photorhabdus sp. S8-52]